MSQEEIMINMAASTTIAQARAAVVTRAAHTVFVKHCQARGLDQTPQKAVFVQHAQVIDQEIQQANRVRISTASIPGVGLEHSFSVPSGLLSALCEGTKEGRELLNERIAIMSINPFSPGISSVPYERYLVARLSLEIFTDPHGT
jgi:hypothetical protein